MNLVWVGVFKLSFSSLVESLKVCLSAWGAQLFGIWSEKPPLKQQPLTRIPNQQVPKRLIRVDVQNPASGDWSRSIYGNNPIQRIMNRLACSNLWHVCPEAPEWRGEGAWVMSIHDVVGGMKRFCILDDWANQQLVWGAWGWARLAEHIIMYHVGSFSTFAWILDSSVRVRSLWVLHVDQLTPFPHFVNDFWHLIMSCLTSDLLFFVS